MGRVRVKYVEKCKKWSKINSLRERKNIKEKRRSEKWINVKEKVKKKNKE